MTERERLEALCIKAWDLLKIAKESCGKDSESVKYFRTKWYTLDLAYTIIYEETVHYE